MTKKEIIKTTQIYPEYKHSLKSPWINVEDDLPCYHMDLIRGTEIDEGTETIDVFAANEDGYIWDDYMIYENGKWRWNDIKPAYWMIPPKLPKERKQNYGTKSRRNI